MKKWKVVALCAMFAGMAAAGCGPSSGGDDASAGQVKLTVYSTAGDEPVKQVYEQVARDFEQEHPGVQVEVVFPGSEYENILKVKMAANDLPDVFDTHGWAQIRYGKYVADLRDQPWADELSDSMKPVLTDKDGKVYALPLNEAKDGLTYNAAVLEMYNIPVPNTLDELIAAGEKIRQASNGEVTPFFFSGTDSWSIGQFYDYFSTSLLISPPDNHADELLTHHFDWSKWTLLPAKFKEMADKGLINEDALTAKYSDGTRLFAEGKVAFLFTGPSSVSQAKEINPQIQPAIMPVPSIVPGDQPTFSGGERYTMAVWKDSPNLELAKQFVTFSAKPEYLKRFAEASKLPAGVKGINPDLGDLTDDYEKYQNIRVFPYFDRVYLPNGMWDVMCTQGQELISGAISPEQFAETMGKQVERLRSQQQ